MNTLLWEVLTDVTNWGQTQKSARTDEVRCINGARAAEQGLNTRRSEFNWQSFIDWLTGGSSLHMCQVMQVIRGQVL